MKDVSKFIPGLNKAIELINGINQNDFAANEVKEFKNIALMMLIRYRDLAKNVQTEKINKSKI